MKRKKRPTYWALQTPSGIVIPAGTKKPKLTRQDKKDYWRVFKIKKILAK